jgi:serine/threonine-protein kinase
VPAAPPTLAALIAECLYKSPQARPTPANILARLQSVQRPVSEAEERLRRLNQVAADQRARVHAQSSVERSNAERRQGLLSAAEQSFQAIRDSFAARVADAAPGSILTGESFRFRLNSAVLHIAPCQAAAALSGAIRIPFDVVAYASVYVKIPSNRHRYEGRSHSLWYCDAQRPGVYRWYETAFMTGVFQSYRQAMEPFALPPNNDAAGAFSRAGGKSLQLAWPFTAVDQGEDEEFVQRWVSWFADGAEGRLTFPSRMPERDPSGSWREAERA